MNASESNKMKFLKVRLESRLKLLTEFLEASDKKESCFFTQGRMEEIEYFLQLIDEVNNHL